MRRSLISIAIPLLVAAGAARADESTLSPLPKPRPAEKRISIQGYGAANPACLEWSDGCQVCVSGAVAGCSTPGPACTPGRVVCAKTK